MGGSYIIWTGGGIKIFIHVTQIRDSVAVELLFAPVITIKSAVVN